MPPLYIFIVVIRFVGSMAMGYYFGRLNLPMSTSFPLLIACLLAWNILLVWLGHVVLTHYGY